MYFSLHYHIYYQKILKTKRFLLTDKSIVSCIYSLNGPSRARARFDTSFHWISTGTAAAGAGLFLLLFYAVYLLQ